MNPRAVLLSVASGVLFGAAWRGSIPALCGVLGLGLFFVGQQYLASRNWLRRLAMAWLTGFTAFAIACTWVFDTAEYLLETESMFVLVPVAFAVWSIHAFPFLLFALLFRHCERVANSLAVMPPLWLLCEQLSPSLFPFPVGSLLVDVPWLAQPAEIGGVSLLSLIAGCYALVVPGLYRLWQHWCSWRQERQNRAKAAERRRDPKGKRKGRGRKSSAEQEASVGIASTLVGHWRVGLIPCMLGLALIWGAAQISHLEKAEGEGESLDILIVQADTAHERANARMLGAAAKVEGKADLVLWPECSIGNFEQSLIGFADDAAVAEAFKSATEDDALKLNPVGCPQTPLLLGGDSWKNAESGGETQEYVSAYLVDRGGAILGRHDKVSLMPYGESIPGESLFPFLRDWFGSQRVISRGESIRPVGLVQGMSLGAVLCCEDMVPELSRTLVREGADVLISLANGIAFKSEVALQQHFRISRCRAIENRRYFVRCASRGVSAVVAPSGAIVEELPILEDCAKVVRVRASSQKTMYSSFGMLPAMVSALILVALGLRLPVLAFASERFRFRPATAKRIRTETLVDVH
ncbi:MAG: apolipoprotein N-acyltransferase [Aureliella sp.]